MITIGVVVAAALTFNTPPPGRLECCGWIEVPGPVVIDGWHFSSTFNAWITPDPLTVEKSNWLHHDSPWLGFLGNSPATFTVSLPGSQFSFYGFDSIGLQTAPGRVVGSHGQFLDYFTMSHLATHYEVEWHDLDWIQFQHDIHPHFGANGLDNLDVVVSRVYEPSTLELLGIAFTGLLLFGVTRKLRWQ